MCHEQGSSPSGSLLRKAAFLKSLIEVNALLSLRGGRATISLERKRGDSSFFLGTEKSLCLYE